VEINLLNDRGFILGLKAGGGVSWTLPSISPGMKWP
jgi:coproporphyrinogen III oxidase